MSSELDMLKACRLYSKFGVSETIEVADLLHGKKISEGSTTLLTKKLETLLHHQVLMYTKPVAEMLLSDSFRDTELIEPILNVLRQLDPPLFLLEEKRKIQRGSFKLKNQEAVKWVSSTTALNIDEAIVPKDSSDLATKLEQGCDIIFTFDWKVIMESYDYESTNPYIVVMNYCAYPSVVQFMMENDVHNLVNDVDPSPLLSAIQHPKLFKALCSHKNLDTQCLKSGEHSLCHSAAAQGNFHALVEIQKHCKVSSSFLNVNNQEEKTPAALIEEHNAFNLFHFGQLAYYRKLKDLIPGVPDLRHGVPGSRYEEMTYCNVLSLLDRDLAELSTDDIFANAYCNAWAKSLFFKQHNTAEWTPERRVRRSMPVGDPPQHQSNEVLSDRSPRKIQYDSME